MNDNELIGPVNGIGEIAHRLRQRAGSLRTSTNVSSDEFQRNFIAGKAPNPVDDQEQAEHNTYSERRLISAISGRQV